MIDHLHQPSPDFADLREEVATWLTDFELAPRAIDALARIALAGPDQLVIISDWDGVVTEKHPDGIGGTTWEVLRDCMPTADVRARYVPDHPIGDPAAEHGKLYRHYSQYEREGTLTFEQAESWQRNAMNLLIGANMGQIKERSRGTIILRPGAEDLINACSEQGIPFGINSTGSAEVIEAVLQKHKLEPAFVSSNRFDTDEDGIIVGLTEGTMTHSLNKDSRTRKFTAPYERTAAIGIGDNKHDTHILGDDGSEAHLRLRLDGGMAYHTTRYGVDGWVDYVVASFLHNFDAVATGSDMHGLVRIIAKLGQIGRQAA